MPPQLQGSVTAAHNGRKYSCKMCPTVSTLFKSFFSFENYPCEKTKTGNSAIHLFKLAETTFYRIYDEDLFCRV
jgi:hypothetical protein